MMMDMDGGMGEGLIGKYWYGREYGDIMIEGGGIAAG
jgi:hypothetical protein